MKYILIIPIVAISLNGLCQRTQAQNTAMKRTFTQATCSDKCSDHCGNSRTLSCKLTTPELQARKATVITQLKKQVIQKKKLDNGYSYRFKGTDSVMDELIEFIKTERKCCDFFDFSIKVTGNASEAWLSITGPKGARDFIDKELGL